MCTCGGLLSNLTLARPLKLRCSSVGSFVSDTFVGTVGTIVCSPPFGGGGFWAVVFPCGAALGAFVAEFVSGDAAGEDGVTLGGCVFTEELGADQLWYTRIPTPTMAQRITAIVTLRHKGSPAESSSSSSSRRRSGGRS